MHPHTKKRSFFVCVSVSLRDFSRLVLHNIVVRVQPRTFEGITDLLLAQTCAHFNANVCSSANKRKVTLSVRKGREEEDREREREHLVFFVGSRVFSLLFSPFPPFSFGTICNLPSTRFVSRKQKVAGSLLLLFVFPPCLPLFTTRGCKQKQREEKRKKQHASHGKGLWAQPFFFDTHIIKLLLLHTQERSSTVVWCVLFFLAFSVTSPATILR